MDVKQDKDSVTSDTMNNTDAILKANQKSENMTTQSDNFMNDTLKTRTKGQTRLQ